MIFAPGKFVMYTPVKTGTRTYVSLAKNSPDMYWDGRWHMATIPERMRKLDRIILVRNPYDRLISMYHWLRAHPGEKWHADELAKMDFQQFVIWLAERKEECLEQEMVDAGKQTWRWVLSQSEIADFFFGQPGSIRRQTPFPLEQTDKNLRDLKQRYGIRTTWEQPKRLNTTDAERGPVGERSDVEELYKGDVLDVFNEMWGYDDCYDFGYPIKET